MRKYLLVLFLFLSQSNYGQIKLVTNNTISKPLSQLIQAYPSGFAGLRGELVDVGSQTNGYACLVKIEGAEPGIINGFTYGKDSVFTWSDNLFTTEDFSKAKQEYKKIFTEVKGTKIFENGKSISLKGAYEEPSETIGFASVAFVPENEIESLKNLVVDLTLQYTDAEWKITLSIYDKDKDLTE